MANNKQKVLGLNDLGTVLTEIHSVRAKWYNIGLQLSVPVADLQRIESEYKNDHGTCLRHMLIKWLEMGCATWKALIDALQSPIVQGGENNALADTLSRRYCGEVGEEEGKNKGKKRKASETINPTPGGAPPSTKVWYTVCCTMVGVKIKGTTCGLYNVVPLSGHSLHKLQAQLGSYTTLRQLHVYHTLAVGWETIVQAS